MTNLPRWLISCLLLAGLIGYALWPVAPDITAAITPSVLISEQRLTPGLMNASSTAYGSIQPGLGGEITIAPPAGGIVGSMAVTTGQRVAAGQVLATLDPDALSIADATKAVSAVAAAKSNLVHVSALLASHLATDADFSAAAQTLRDAQATLTAISVTGAGLQRRLDAPFAGIITAVLANSGSAFAAGTPLLRIANETSEIAAVDLPPEQASRIKAGASAKLTLLDTGDSLAATVTGVGAMLDPQTGLLPVQLALNTHAYALLDQPVEADITAQTLPGYVLPRAALQTEDAGDFVYQIDPHNIAHRVPVHILIAAGSQILIVADIDPSLPVAVTGAPQLADGMAVRTVP